MWNWLTNHGKRIARITAGIVLLIVGGILMLPGVPGPGFIVVFAGLSVLAADFAWARRLRMKLRRKAGKIADKIRGRS